MGKTKTKGRPAKASRDAGHTLSALAQAHGVSRSVVNRALELGDLPPEAFPTGARGRRSVGDYEAASTALSAFLERPPRLGRPALSQSRREPASSSASDVEWRRRAIVANLRVLDRVEALRGRLPVEADEAGKALGAIETLVLELDGMLADGARGPLL